VPQSDVYGVTTAAIELGMALFTLVEPHAGHEVAYNRWYEGDHFYAGCQIGPFNLAGNRYVATRDLKALRYPDPSPIVPDRDTGSYVALYWVLAGHTEEWNRWAVAQVNALHAAGRMFTDRDHIHTLLYDFDFAVARDSSVVRPYQALDHPYAGVVAVVGDGREPGGRARLDAALRDSLLPELLTGSPVAQVLQFTPHPLRSDAPGDVVRVAAPADRFLQLWFCERDPRECWDEVFAGLGARLDAAEVDVAWVSPFIPTVWGTDTYTDQLH